MVRDRKLPPKATGYALFRGLLGGLFQVLKVAAATQGSFVRYQIVEGNEMHWNPEESARHLFFLRVGELYAGDFGQNVNPYRSDPNLVNDLPFGERLRRDAVMVEGSTKLFEGPNHSTRILP